MQTNGSSRHGLAVPGHPDQQAGQTAEARDAGKHQPCPDETGQQVKPGRNADAQHEAEHDHRAGGDLYLPLQLEGL